MNRVMLSGRLTENPDIKIRNSSNGKLAVATFVLAVPRTSNPSEANFIHCVSFGNTAEIIKKYVTQGMKIIVDDGEWMTDKYTDRDGNKIYTNQCVVKHFEFAESKQRQSNNQDFMNMSEKMKAGLPFT